MTEKPNWLPDFVLLEDYGGDWSGYLEVIYQYFRKDFVTSFPRFYGKPCKSIGAPYIQGKEWSFWHLISEGQEEDERIPDLRRCERIRWPRPMIEVGFRNSVRCWYSVRGRRRRIVLALGDFSYVVILSVEKKQFVLVTAFCVDNLRRQEKLRKEFKEAEKCENRQNF